MEDVVTKFIRFWFFTILYHTIRWTIFKPLQLIERRVNQGKWNYNFFKDAQTSRSPVKHRWLLRLTYHLVKFNRFEIYDRRVLKPTKLPTTKETTNANKI